MASAASLNEVLASIGWTTAPSHFTGKKDWFDAYGELIGAFDAHEGWEKVRKYLSQHADADHDGIGYVPNREMALMCEGDAAFRHAA